MTEGQPVTVVGNLAEISKAATRGAQDNFELPNAVDIVHAVGRPVDQNRPQAQPINANSQVSHNVPINHVSDYDVLDLDLAGLKQISKTGFAAEGNPWQSNAPPAGNFPLQITQGMQAWIKIAMITKNILSVNNIVVKMQT